MVRTAVGCRRPWFLNICQANCFGQQCLEWVQWKIKRKAHGAIAYRQLYSEQQLGRLQEGRRNGETYHPCLLKPPKSSYTAAWAHKHIHCYISVLWHPAEAWCPKVNFPWLHLQGCAIPKTVFPELRPSPSKVAPAWLRIWSLHTPLLTQMHPCVVYMFCWSPSPPILYGIANRGWHIAMILS
jgi:hypothetical protein